MTTTEQKAWGGLPARAGRFVQRHGRPLASLVVAGCSFYVWGELGLVRWGTAPWMIDAPRGELTSVYQALAHADAGAKALAEIAVIWAAIAVRQVRSRFAMISLVIAILVLLISVPLGTSELISPERI